MTQRGEEGCRATDGGNERGRERDRTGGTQEFSPSPTFHPGLQRIVSDTRARTHTNTRIHARTRTRSRASAFRLVAHGRVHSRIRSKIEKRSSHTNTLAYAHHTPRVSSWTAQHAHAHTRAHTRSSQNRTTRGQTGWIHAHIYKRTHVYTYTRIHTHTIRMTHAHTERYIHRLVPSVPSRLLLCSFPPLPYPLNRRTSVVSLPPCPPSPFSILSSPSSRWRALPR